MVYTQIFENRYIDSLEAMMVFSMLTEIPGVQTAYAGMVSQNSIRVLEDLGLMNDAVADASDSDMFLVVRAESREVFQTALEEASRMMNSSQSQTEKAPAYPTLEAACRANKRANICTISVPGEYACEVTMQALNRGLHCVVFSNNVPLEQERQMKELAREKGLLCMGPDCGVANINGAAFVLSSINNRGPVGICGASGCGIQHVAAFLHEAGSGVSQTIGTGGNDLKEQVGGISMLMGIDALENDPETEYIVLISRKPADSVMRRILDRVKTCRKQTVVCFLGAEEEPIVEAGAIYARDLDDCALRAMELVGKHFTFDTPRQLHETALRAAAKLSPDQKYVRGIYCGGTYCDEAMETLQDVLGGIHSNCPLRPQLRLHDAYVSEGNSVIDAGEEEFTKGRPHPTLEPSMRLPLIEKEGDDPQTAVVLMDFILTPAANSDPAGVTLKTIQSVVEKSRQRGGEIAVVASVLGTDADIQDVKLQRKKLADAGVYVCKSNKQAAALAAEIVRLANER